MAKIVEFHEAAALAEISLSIEIYKARKQLNNSKEEDAPRVLEHQKRMVQLQKEKEEERKAIVKSERARRQSDLGRRPTRGAVHTPSSAFKTWGLSSFQEEMPLDLPSRFNLDTLLSEDPAKQHVNVENLLSQMFANDDDSQPYPTPEYPAPAGLFNSHSSTSTSSNQDGFHGSMHSMQEQLHQRHSSMSWNKPQSNSSSKPTRKTHLSPFGESSDDEEDHRPTAAAAIRKSNENENVGRGIDEDTKPTTSLWNTKPNASTAAGASIWSSKDVRATPVSSAWSSKKATTAPIPQPRQGSSILSNPNPLVADEIEPEPTATPVTNSKTAKGKKLWGSALEKPSISPPAVETSTNKAPAAETPAAPAKIDKPVPTPVPAPTPALAPNPVGKKLNKKQRLANNKKGGAAATAAAPGAVAEPAAIPEQEPETEPAPTQQESPKLETAAPVPEPVLGGSEHTSWLPKMVPAMARARMDSGPTTPSFSWDEVASTPRPAPKIPAHLQEALKSEGTIRVKKQNLMAEVFNATSSRTTLEQMPPAPPITRGLWGPTPTAATPGPSLWGKTKADFDTAKVVQQPAGGDFWVPGAFESVNDYNDEGGGGGGGGEDVGGLWESMAAHSKQIGKAASIPVKQPQSSIAAQRLRRVSEAASSPVPRALGIKDLSDIGQPAPQTIITNSTSKKARAKKNAKGKQRVTVEDVSDEEKDNIDILPLDSSHIMESKTILEPKPSIPSVVYNSIIDFTDSDDVNNGSGYGSSSFKPTTSTASSSSADDIFSSFPGAFKTQGLNTSSGVEWGAMSGKHARWTPAVSDRETSGSPPSFSAAFGSRLQAKPATAQQTPTWGQPTKTSAKDKGKGK